MWNLNLKKPIFNKINPQGGQRGKEVFSQGDVGGLKLNHCNIDMVNGVQGQIVKIVKKGSFHEKSPQKYSN